MSLCGGCNLSVINSEKITCAACSKIYHFSCGNLSRENVSKLSLKAKSIWKCPDCKIPRKRSDNSNTPNKNDVVVSDEQYDVTSQDALDKKFAQLESSIVTKMKCILRTELESLQRDVRLIPELKQTIEFLSNRYDVVNSELEGLKTLTADLRRENTKLTEVINELTGKVNSIEQQTRECNLEIQCLPEFHKENITNTVVQLAKILSCPLEQKDILSSTRVAKSNSASKRPKNIIVKLPSSRIRDNMIAACLTYNKAHPKEKLHSGLLGLAGDKQQIYLCEHLSPSNRSLHAQARLFRREGKYKYLWVRNGRILMRKDDESPVIWIRNSDTLQGLKC